MTIEQLLNAVSSGAPLLVRPCGEPSSKGVQELQALSVRDGKMQARCLASGHTEIFRIESIELLTEAVVSASALTALTRNERHATTHH